CVASPKPHALRLAAAAIAGADGLVAAGGAHAIAALAYGAGPIAPRDVIVGPGNRYVTAAKHLVSGAVAIDLLAGPSELTVFADDTADPGSVAADLLAQAEHDPDAVPTLVTLDPTLPDRVEAELAHQLSDLPTAETARSTGGLSVYSFLRVRTWLCIEDRAAALPLIEDAIWLGRAEGLEAHARAAERRLVEEPDRMARPARGFPTP